MLLDRADGGHYTGSGSKTQAVMIEDGAKTSSGMGIFATKYLGINVTSPCLILLHSVYQVSMSCAWARACPGWQDKAKLVVFKGDTVHQSSTLTRYATMA